MKDWQEAAITPDHSVLEAVRTIDRTGLRVALVLGEAGELLGVVTDGDVRRAILRGAPLEDSVREVMNTHPITVRSGAGRDEIIRVMRHHVIREVPVLDDAGRVVALETLDEITAPTQRDNMVVIMAGGEGRRLRPLTDNTPKPMLKVGGKPLLETIVSRFVAQGFPNLFITINYLGDRIVDHFGDGSRWDANIRYVREEKFLGTAGALSLLPSAPENALVVMNGDVLTDLEFHRLIDFHTQNGAAATMCVREHESVIPYGVVEIDDHEFVQIREKPTSRYFINAGAYVISPEVLPLIPRNTRFDMTDLFGVLRDRRMKTVVFPLTEYWSDIGREVDFLQANSDYETIF